MGPTKKKSKDDKSKSKPKGGRSETRTKMDDSNECKQTRKRSKSLSSPKNLDVTLAKRRSSQKEKDKTSNVVTEVNFQEGDDKVEMSVAGQYTEFVSDGECDPKDSEERLGGSNDEEDSVVLSQNNNATKDNHGRMSRKDRFERENAEKSRMEETPIRRRDSSDDSQDEDERMFNKWEKFLKKRGMKIMQDEDMNPCTSKDKYEAVSDRNDGKIPYLGNDKDTALSEVTIYRPAVEKVDSNRLSSSSEEGEKHRNCENDDPEFVQEMIDRFVGVNRVVGTSTQDSRDVRTERDDRSNRRGSDDEPMGGDHLQITEDPGVAYRRDQDMDIQARAELMIKEAERSKAKIFEVPGKNIDILNSKPIDKMILYSLLLDEEYPSVGGHLDQQIIEKIRRGKYVDFAKLLSKDRSDIEDNHRMELVNRGGYSYYMPVAEKEKTKITSIYLWDAAFHVFAKIYTQAYPHRSPELIEYSHNIHEISETYVWKNVYKYDREFRLHMERNPG